MEEQKDKNKLIRIESGTEKMLLASRKLIDMLLIAALHILLILSIVYAGYQLVFEVIANFSKTPNKLEFPFILTMAEHIFLYFLPVFILFGLLHYYKFDLRNYLLEDFSSNKSGAKTLSMSKKLFFSNVLSYTALKIIEELFFTYSPTKIYQLIAIGIFFLFLIVLVLIQDRTKVPETHSDK